MAVIETWLHQDLQEPVKVNYLDGNLFSNNGNGNRIGVVLTNNGEALASISGTVSGYVVTADGSTVPCTGSKSGNRASILIPAAAYQPGSIFITVFVTDGTTVTTIGAVSTTVMRSRTNAQVDPGSAVTDWTQTINAAMQSVETAAANLGGIVAVPYASITFPVPLGKYTYYNNNLYRCITPIASSESFTAAHWTQVRLGDDVSDLKSAIKQDVVSKNNIVPFPYKDQAILSAGIYFTPDHRNLHIEGTPTGMATFQIFGTWGANNNIQNTQFVPGKTYFILNKDPLFKIVFFDSSGTALRFISASVNSFTVPVGSTGANLYYQFTGAGSYVNYYFLPFIVDESTYRKQIESEYDCSVPVRTEYDGWHIEETYFSGRKKITDIDYDTIVERLYESDGTTLKATRTTSIIGEVISTELVPAT